MNRYEAGLFLGVCVLGLLTSALYEFMAFRVNRQLPPNRRFQHFPFGPCQRSRLEAEYKGLFPRSIVYRLLLQCAVVMLALALAMVALRSWEYVSR